MYGKTRSRVVLVASVAAAFTASSLVFGSVTSAPSLADSSTYRTLRLAPHDDAFGASQEPNRGFGQAQRLVSRNTDGVRKTSYLKFTVTKEQLDGGTIERAFLVVRVREALAVPVSVRTVSHNNWNEKQLTYRTAPRTERPVGTMPAGSGPLRWVGVTDVVTEPGTYSFALTTSRGIARFASSESQRPPSLVLRIKHQGKGGAIPSPTASPTSAPTASAVPSPTDGATTGPVTTTSSDPAPDPSPPTTDRPCRQGIPGAPCDGQMYYGASVEGGDPRPLEAELGQGLTVFRSYMSASSAASKFASRASADVAAGRIPLISTKLPGSWADVAAGKHDAWLLERVRALAAVDGPVWLTLHHEPSGDGPPADWVAMQQHARKIIDANADNIALVGILNGWDFLERGGNPGVFNHPVGSGVHIMGFDTYNPWSPTNGKTWKPVSTAMSPGVTIAQWGYPTLVGEYGVRTDPEQPGRAADWLREAYGFGVSHGFLAMSYFDSGANSPDGTWDLTGERLAQFGRNLAQPETAHLRR